VSDSVQSDAPPKRTPLHGLHLELGAKMVPFAGYEMPVQYPAGVLKEHLHTRAAAGLFDVSHMGQVRISGPGAAAALEALVPADVQGLGAGRQRYTMFTDARGGILDDLMVADRGDHLFLVVNASCKEADLTLLRAGLPSSVSVEYLGDDRGLLALQGPAAAAVMADLLPAAAAMPFMSVAEGAIGGIPVQLSRSGYTGEDGWEISVAPDRAADLARLLLARPEVMPIGLGARDSLRLEAGLCLYGHDIDTTTTPVEAGLSWTIQKRRRAEGGFPGAETILRQLAEGPARKRVGIRPEGRQPAREGTRILDASGAEVGRITSGGYGPTVEGPVAMGYVRADLAAPGTPVALEVRGKEIPARVAAMPFAPHRYFKG
jgi:aminomethyltransferase